MRWRFMIGKTGTKFDRNDRNQAGRVLDSYGQKCDYLLVRKGDEMITEIKTGRPFDTDELVAQIGMMNVFAISGGRVHQIVNDEGEVVRVEFPVSHGYRVAVELGWNDTYTVTREFVRRGIVAVKGQIEQVYCDEIGEIAYQASCFRNVEFGEVNA